MKRSLLFSGVLVIGVATLVETFVVRAKALIDESLHPTNQSWLGVGGSLAGDRYSALAQITMQNVSDLGATWISANMPDGSSSRVTPVVDGDRMFVTAGAHVLSLNAATGERIWDFSTSGLPEGLAGLALLGTGMPNSQGVGLGEGLIFVGLNDAHLLALSERDGKLVWNQDLGDVPGTTAEGVSTAPIYANGMVFCGLATNERYIGKAMAVDAKTGKKLWTFAAIPGPGEPGHETWPKDSDAWKHGSGSIWQYPVVDPSLGVVYFGTGNADPVFSGEVRAGDNLYTSSVVALDMKSGKLKWYYQIVHHDLWETDVATPLILYNVEMDGRMRQGIGIIRSADGRLFLLDRTTGKPLTPVHERPVPQDSFNKTSPTQPFPDGDSILRDCSEWKAKIPMGFQLGCAFTPLTVQRPNLLLEGPYVRYEPLSYDPQTGYIYLQGKDDLVWFIRGTDPFTHMLSGGLIPGQNKYNYSVLAAIDTRTNRLVWRNQVSFASGFGSGGWLTTAGGLAFHRMSDGNFAAFDAKTGETLWQFQTGHPAGDASPMSYEINGQQYIAVSEGPAIWAFRLGGAISQAPKAPEPSLDSFGGGGPGQPVDTRVIETSALQYTDIGDTGKRYFINRYMFNPMHARVKVGAPVIFADNGLENHTIVATDGSWTTGTLEPTETATLKFDKPGTYDYYCKEHPWSHGAIVVVVPNVPAQANASPAAGSFASQVLNGETAYEQSCSMCHMSDLSGNGEAAPALTGAGFLARWQGRTASDLLAKTRSTMPPFGPGSLSEQDYVSIVAYILHSNNFSSRTSLSLENVKAISMTK